MRETIQNANGKQFHAVSLSGVLFAPPCCF